MKFRWTVRSLNDEGDLTEAHHEGTLADVIALYPEERLHAIINRGPIEATTRVDSAAGDSAISVEKQELAPGDVGDAAAVIGGV